MKEGVVIRYKCSKEYASRSRFGKLSFNVDMDSELHGFGGYFECVLFKDVVISINPATHSKGKKGSAN